MKLEDQLRETIRMQGKSPKTFDAYWGWCKQFLLFAREKRGKWVHPSELRERQVEIWLKHLANDLNVSANTQNQAFSALCYLYRHVLKQPSTSALGKRMLTQKTNVFIGLLKISGFQNAKKRNVLSSKKTAWNHFGIIRTDKLY